MAPRSSEAQQKLLIALQISSASTTFFRSQASLISFAMPSQCLERLKLAPGPLSQPIALLQNRDAESSVAWQALVPLKSAYPMY